MKDRAPGECPAIHPQDLEPCDPEPAIYPAIYPDIHLDIHRDIHREAPDRSGADTSKIHGELT
jgi:hypothetical protein